MQLLFLRKEDLELPKIVELDDTKRGSNGLVWFYRKVKRMSKLVTKEFDFCHKFIESSHAIVDLKLKKMNFQLWFIAKKKI